MSAAAYRYLEQTSSANSAGNVTAPAATWSTLPGGTSSSLSATNAAAMMGSPPPIDCPECGGPMTPGSARCAPCHHETMMVRVNTCDDCGRYQSDSRRRRCMSCHRKHQALSVQLPDPEGGVFLR